MIISVSLLLPVNLLTLGLVFKLFTIANCANLFGLPMKSTKANMHIEATIIDKLDDDRKWSVSEDLAGISVPHGRIHVAQASQSFDIFYHHTFDDKRLIISDYECNQMESAPDLWSFMTPGIRQPLLNLLILAGPSFIYRLSDKSLKWVETEERVDGVTMKTTLNDTLRIKVYFEHNKTSEMEQAVRIDFDGYLIVPGMTFISKVNESLVLKILSQTRITENLDVKVQPTTGIGCPTYFQLDKEFPRLTTRQLHFTAIETLTSDLNMHRNKEITNVEVYFDGDKKLTRLGTDNNYTINDFNLGVSYVFNGGKCIITPFNRYIPGLIGGQLSVNELTWMNGQFKFVGATIYEPRARGVFDTWESTEYGRTIDGHKYDKVVTIQYMARLLIDINGPKSVSVDYIPVAMVRVAYKKDPTGKYFVAESRRRDISEFQQAITKTQYQNLFGISDCFEKDQRMILTFDIRSEENGYTCSSSGTLFAEENMYEFKESLKSKLTKQVSPLRIISIDLDFHVDRISAKVEFLEKPPLEKSFQSKDAKVKVGVKMLTNFGGVSAKSIDECLKSQITGKYFRQILYCPSNNGLCLDIDDLDTLFDNDDEYTDCSLYTFPLNNRNRLSKEVVLYDLLKTLLRLETENMMITMKCDNCSTPAKVYRYRIINVLDFTLFDQKIDKRPSFMEVQKSSKLDARDRQVHLVGGSIENFGDCYRTCASSDNSDCVAFSYCSNGDTSECLTSSTLFMPNSTINSVNCTTYGRNFILEYLKAPYKKLIDTMDEVTIQSRSADACAAECSKSINCFSFQYCRNNQCTFTGSSYTIKKVKQDPYCDVYTPKKSQEFLVTGSTVVVNYIANENKLDLEQCAALCYNWKAGNESCKSFNFCPKGRLESTCQLTQYTVGDSNVQTSPSQYCFNFELIAKPQPPLQANSIFIPKDDVSNATTSISLAFLVIGLALGIAATSIYHTIHNRQKYRVTIADQDSDL